MTDEVDGFLPIDPERVQRQCIEARAALIIALRKRAGSGERHFEPQPRKMQRSERPGGSRANGRNYVFFGLRRHVVTSKIRGESEKTVTRRCDGYACDGV